MAEVTIYLLTEPDGGVGRYVGQTVDLKRRFIQHLYPYDETHNTNWIKSLLRQGKKPGMEILAIIDAENADDAEKAYIAAFKMMGFKLTNGTDGGDGTRGRKASEKTRQKMSESRKGVKATKETRRKMSEAAKNRSEETCQKISETLRGRKHTEESCRKMSEAQKGRKHTEAHKAKIRGKKNVHAKMTDAKVIECRRLCATGRWTRRRLAIKYNVSHCVINKIIHRKTWGHVP